MSELNTVAAISATSITSNEATLKAAIKGIGTIVDLRAGTLALAEHGLKVQASIDAIAGDLEIASTLTIDSAEMLDEAQQIAGRLASVCADSGDIETERKALTSPFNDLVKKINEGYNAPKDHVAAVLKDVKKKILDYSNEQARIAREKEEQDQRDREAAAIAAANAEAKASTKANDLLQQAQDAQAAGSDITAAALMQQASTVIDTARQQASVASTALFTRSVAAPVAQAKGVRGKWKAEVLDKAKYIAHVGALIAKGDLSLLDTLDVNVSNLNKLADLQKQNLSLPGVAPRHEQSVSVRKVAA